MFLDEQFRIYTLVLTSFINYNFYYSQIINTIKSIAPLLNIKFFKDLFSDKLGITYNFVVIVVKELKSFTESSSNSIYNLSTQYFVIELIQDIVYRLQSNEYTIDRDMTLVNITPYKAKAIIIQTEINYRGLKNYNALVSEVVQGISRNGIFLILLNTYYLIEFSTEPRRLLIKLTRYRKGLAIIIPDGALVQENYNLNSEAEIYRSHVSRVKSLVDIVKA